MCPKAFINYSFHDCLFPMDMLRLNQLYIIYKKGMMTLCMKMLYALFNITGSFGCFFLFFSLRFWGSLYLETIRTYRNKGDEDMITRLLAIKFHLTLI